MSEILKNIAGIIRDRTDMSQIPFIQRNGGVLSDEERRVLVEFTERIEAYGQHKKVKQIHLVPYERALTQENLSKQEKFKISTERRGEYDKMQRRNQT